MEPIPLAPPQTLRELTLADAPFAGTLCGGDPPTVWIDAAVFASSPAWAAGEAEHVLAPMDAGRTLAGDRVVVEHCPFRLGALVEAGGVDAAGAAVTVAVSMLRGAAEADAVGAEVGSWWVTTAGRPMLALTGSAAWRVEAASILEALRTRVSTELSSLLADAATALSDARSLRREAERVEAALFEVALPGPLELAPRADAAPPHATRVANAPEARRSSSVVASLVDTIAGALDRQFADRLRGVGVSLAAMRSRSRPTARRPHRRRAVLLAGAAGTAVVAAGLFWPATADPGPDPRSSTTATASPTASTTPAPPSSPATSAPAADPDDDIAVQGAALVRAVAGCTERCDGFWEEPHQAASIPAAVGDFTVEVIDEYGGVAALRVSGDAPAQVVVIVRRNDEWLVREVYDLADQP
ncbi:hypothetical protein [Microbacterium dauci]|uniref:Uncharacterized protein n=1 Tax=Microbacterium dauci TaxID=3048008 RepID=A0ABT6ZGY1_9MICO|nr:hypothetical protein [Microbacterium sp. LX3-4]MDJ1115407.1 hypothetical protein [Microbacterium sp. LX3-4]